MSYYGDKDKGVAALLMLATTPDNQSKRGTRSEGGVAPQRTELSHIAKSRVRAIKGAQDLYRALPELDTICTIAASSILSTKDLVTTTVLYNSTSTDIPLELREDLSSVIKEYFDTKDKFPKKIYRWIHDAMSVKGASPVLVVPETSLREMFDIKVGSEGFKKSYSNIFEKQLGILGSIEPSTKVGAEALFERNVAPDKPQEFTISFSESAFKETLEHSYTITDNPNVLALCEVQRRIARENARSGLGQRRRGSYNGGGQGNLQGMKLEGQIEAEDLLTTKDVNPDADKAQPTQLYNEIPNTHGRNCNHPMTRLLPPESLLPIILGGDERNPIGYLVIIDDTGNPLSSKTASPTDGALFNNLSTDIMAEDIINRNNIGMGQSSVTPEIAQRVISRFAEIAEEKMLNMVSNAIGGGAISTSAQQDWYRIMFSRHLAKRHTQVLYIPAENLSYFATDFNDDGIGVSITERSYILSTIRMSLMFATMNSAILNSARNMQYDIELSPTDKNGQATVDRIKADIINSYNNSLPVWGDVEDTFRASTNAGLAFNVEGNEWYPSQKVSISDTTPDYKIPDPDLDESYLRRTCSLARVDPDLVLTPENIEFASQIFSKSLIVTQQVMKIQEELEKPLTNYVTSYTLGSGPILDELAATVAKYNPRQQNESDSQFEDRLIDVVEDFIDSLVVSLPPPDTSAGESQMEQFDKRMEFFERLGTMVVSDDIVSAMQDAGFDGDGDNLRTMVTSFYARSWLRKNDMEGDFFGMFDESSRADTVKAISNDVRDVTAVLDQLHRRVVSKVATVVGETSEGDDENYSAADSGDTGGEDESTGDDFDMGADGGEEDDMFSDGDSDEEGGEAEGESTDSTMDDVTDDIGEEDAGADTEEDTEVPADEADAEDKDI